MRSRPGRERPVDAEHACSGSAIEARVGLVGSEEDRCCRKAPLGTRVVTGGLPLMASGPLVFLERITVRRVAGGGSR